MRKVRFALVALLLILAAGFLYLETFDITVVHREIKDKELSNVFGKARVVHISDLHVTKHWLIEGKLLNLIDNISPDIIFFTGDFVDGPGGIERSADVVRKLSMGRIVIAVLGNSDVSHNMKKADTDRLLKALQDTGIRLLINESIMLTGREKVVNGNHVSIIGLNDNFTWSDDIFRAEKGLPEKGPRILLAHAPNIVEKVDLSKINLVLSGHTHGGQIRLPFLTPFYLNRVCNSKKRFVSGVYLENGVPLIVNRGIGTSSLPIRLLSRPEITIIDFI